MTRQSTNQAQQRARVSARRARANRHAKHLTSIGQGKPRGPELTKHDLSNWFAFAWRRLAQMGKKA